MARLNESIAPTESLDALKRRFVRQNREIARVNSIQSLRIRSLESEVSHLLSENVSLREQSISLGQELERYEAAKMLHDGVYDIKAKLDTKLAELGGLITDLGGLPRKFGKSCVENAEPTIPTHSRLSSVDLRRRATTDFEYNTAPEDGRLPAILEDKCYPRKTLESQELHELLQNNQNGSESPHVEEVTPNEREQESNRLSPELPGGLTDFQIIDSNNTEELDNLLPPTLETRKKRKPSPIAMSKTEFDLDGSATTNHGMEFSLKSGAKRKFMPEDETLVPAASEDDDFQYTRPSHLQNPVDQSAPVHGVPSPIKKEVGRKRTSREHDSSKRKVLEPKSTNIKGTSPNQSRNPRNQKHHKHQESPCLQNGDKKAEMNSRQIYADENSLDHHRDLPAKEDRNAKPRTERQENPSSSTPELPKDETFSDILNAQSRPTRRRGTVVSYAEPNLRDKMRRPTSEFADAVMDGRSRRASNSQSSSIVASDGNEGDKTGGASSKRDSHGSDIIGGDSNCPSVPEQSMSMEIENDHLGAPSSKSAIRKTRRHSSNPRPPSQNSAGSTTEESQYSPSQIYSRGVADSTVSKQRDGSDRRVLETDSYMQPGSAQSTTQELGTKQSRRGHRVATRRKSMMV